MQKPHEHSTKEAKVIHKPINTTYVTPLTLQILNILRLLPYQRGIYRDRGFEVWMNPRFNQDLIIANYLRTVGSFNTKRFQV